MKRLENIYEGEWKTVSLTATALGLTVRERFERFRFEAMSELVLRLAGGLMVAGSTMLWLVLPIGAGTEKLVSHSLLAALVTAVGLFVAIPAVWFYNYLTGRIEFFNVEMDNSSSELVDYFIRIEL